MVMILAGGLTSISSYFIYDKAKKNVVFPLTGKKKEVRSIDEIFFGLMMGGS